jgi:hypothetical protein
MIAHIAGLPIEEWLATVAMSGSGIALAWRAAIGRRQRRR